MNGCVLVRQYCLQTEEVIWDVDDDILDETESYAEVIDSVYKNELETIGEWENDLENIGADEDEIGDSFITVETVDNDSVVNDAEYIIDEDIEDIVENDAEESINPKMTLVVISEMQTMKVNDQLFSI